MRLLLYHKILDYRTSADCICQHGISLEKWCGVVRCVREKWNFDSICREQHGMPFQLSTGVNLESGFINIEKVNQKHIKILLAEKKLNSLRSNDYKYRIKHESVHGFLSSNTAQKHTFPPLGNLLGM